MVLSQCARLAVLGACGLSFATATQVSSQSAHLRLVEALATNSVVKGEEVDETIKKELRDLLGAEIKNAKTQIVDGHKADKQELLDIKADYDTLCKKAFTDKQTELEGVIAGAVATKEQTHKTCRTETLFDDDADQTKECNEILAINSGIRSAASAISAPAGREGWENFWSQVKALLASETSQVNGEDECVKAEGIRAQTVKDCNKNQGDYEDAFCLQRERKDASCTTYASCYDQQLADLQTVTDKNAIGEATRKVEWEAIHKIECFINVILGEGGLTADQAGLSTCKNKAWTDMPVPADGDDLTLPVVELGDKLQCDMTSVSVYPCLAGFTAKYKTNGVDWLDLADCDACDALQSDAGASTGELCGIKAGTYDKVKYKSLNTAGYKFTVSADGHTDLSNAPGPNFNSYDCTSGLGGKCNDGAPRRETKLQCDAAGLAERCTAHSSPTEQATAYVLNTWGDYKHECLYMDGENIKGNHYYNNARWGEIGFSN